MPRLHVLFNKEHVDLRRLPGKVVIVLDVVFATTSIIAALEQGATEVIPTVDAETAVIEAGQRLAGSFVLAGELNTENLPGFADPWPKALIAHELRGKPLIYSTTNGTVALNRVSNAAHVYAAALVNGAAVARHVSQCHAEETVLVLCAGSGLNFNIEDFYGAGSIVSLLTASRPDYRPTDAALAAAMFHDRWDALECLRSSRVGRMMAARDLDDEVVFAAQKNVFETVPKFMSGRVRRARTA
jgi:2-phosphosulfolactate phosphatase